ncbi:substrate-binding domain-containing protein [Luedemannella flava]
MPGAACRTTWPSSGSTTSRSPHTNPPLTTIRQPIEETGTMAARRLLSIIDGDAEEQDPLLPTTLVARASA